MRFAPLDARVADAGSITHLLGIQNEAIRAAAGPMVAWSCQCGTAGTAPELDAAEEWRVHHNAAHGRHLTRDQLDVALAAA